MPSTDLIDQIHQHRSIRRFAAEPVADEDIRRAVAAGQAASTSSAIQGYCLIRVRNDDTRRQLIGLTGGQKKVAECGAFFIVCGDTRRHRLCCNVAGTTYDARLEGFLLAVIDATLFAQNAALAFEAMDYGICFIGGLRNDLPAVQKLMAFPNGVYPLFGLCVGVPAEEPLPRPRLLIDAVLFDDAYPSDERMQHLMNTYNATYQEYLAERGVKEAARRPWTDLMAGQFSTAARTALGPYYTRQGADMR